MKKIILVIVAALALIMIDIGVVFAYLLWQPKNNDTEKPAASASKQKEAPQPAQHTYTSVKGVKIELDNWPENGAIESPFTLTGKVPGSWAFEGEFPIGVVYEEDLGLPGTTAKLEGDWMTEELVPFTATLTFDEKTQASKDVMIILKKANPSGNPENDDSLALKVRFS